MICFMVMLYGLDFNPLKHVTLVRRLQQLGCGATVGVLQQIKNKVLRTASHLLWASPSGQSDDISCIKKTKTLF